MAIPIIFCIDVEPDARLVARDTPSVWPGYEAALAFVSRERSHITAKTASPAHFCWFYRLDPQVAACYGHPSFPLAHYARERDELIAAGDELGIHPHAWRWSVEHSSWMADHGDAQWVSHCLDMCIDTYESVLGCAPESMRHGDKFYSQHLSDRAEARGIKYDLTLEPGTAAAPAIVSDGSELYTGTLADFSQVPIYPYLRSAADWTKPDPNREGGICMIPLSAGTPETALGSWKRRLMNMVGKRLPAPKMMTLNAARHVPTLCRIIDDILNSMMAPYLAFVIRASDTAIPAKRENIEGVFSYLRRHKLAREFVFSRPGEAVFSLGTV